MNAVADAVRVLSRALDQAGDLVQRVHPEHRDLPTPCHGWKVSALVDHLLTDEVGFLEMMRGGQPDWSAATPEVREDWAEVFRERADDLVHAWHQATDAAIDPDWQTAEFAVHSWDLARALDLDTARLDPEVAERGLAFMRANLSAERRGPAFAPEQQAPPGAGRYELLAAFAGRVV
ncbi:DinB family protein [Nocardioides terrisoli]|uniref:DinB family protein n=1 Tax=Nocardioides terrisoli TaxID=3388267 RepID=UPI00287B9F93|nr:DinB family protein [Nocardioides marmorisolisilvae]